MTRYVSWWATLVRGSAVLGAVALLCAAEGRVGADELRMQNGDRYVGKVISLSNDTVVVRSEVLGTVRLPRGKVAQITLGTNATEQAARPAPITNAPPAYGAPAISATNSAPDLPAFRQLGANSNLIHQVQAQFLGTAGPEANAKFNELLGGLMDGSFNLNDLRAEAKSAADQIRELRKEGGQDAGLAIDGYLAILDHFLNETAPPAGAVTNAPAPAKSRPKPPAENE